MALVQSNSQQMRGNCSVNGRSRIRVPPISVLNSTIPSCSATQRPMHRGVLPGRMFRIACKYRFG